MRRSALVGCLLLSLPATVAAQDPGAVVQAPPAVFMEPVSRAEAPVPKDASATKYAGVSRREAEQTMAEFLRCEVKSAKGRAAALAFTREVAGSPSTYPQRLIKSSCAPRGSRMAMNPEMVRMSLFSALYARDFAGGEPMVARIAADDIAKEFDGPPSESTLALRRFGDCAVTKDVADSRALVLSKLYSDDEQRAINALRPALGQCVAEGQALRFSRTIIRGAIAEALYKMSAAPAAAKVN